jgi:hypothetical protein
MTYCQPYSDASHARRVDAFTDWILQRVDELVAQDRDPPLVLPLTVTFSLGSIRSDQVLREYERFYARLCRLLICNYERPSKRRLLPFAPDLFTVLPTSPPRSSATSGPGRPQASMATTGDEAPGDEEVD